MGTSDRGGAPDLPELPELFGRYRIKKKLGRGGMGTVFLVENTELHREEALKVPHFGSDNSLEGCGRFQREARSAARLDHPNLCPVYDVGVVDGVGYFTMRYLHGKALSDYCGKALPASEAVEIVLKLAQAMDYAHSRGVVHRDLKPSNVMLCPGVGPTILDFGLAKQMEHPDLTRTGTALGSPSYMSPEQVRGQPDKIGPATDVYSLGVILFELLTGRLPFEGANEAVVFAQILADDPPAPPSVHCPDLEPGLDAVCLKAMAKKSEDRYASMALFAEALKPFCSAAGLAVATMRPLPDAPARLPDETWSLPVDESWSLPVSSIAKAEPPAVLPPAPASDSGIHGRAGWSPQAGKKRAWSPWLGAAACVGVVFLGVLGYAQFLHPKQETDSAGEVPPTFQPVKEPTFQPVKEVKEVEVSIATEPPGASVLIAGETAGKTPATIKRKPGKYPLTLSLAGFQTAQEELVVAPDLVKPVVIRLKPLPTPEPKAVEVRIVSEPSGANVILDGERIGKTPLVVKRKPGKHPLLLSLPGCRTLQEQLVVGPNLSGTRVFRLTPLSGTEAIEVEVDIQSDPPGASVSLDGESLGKAPVVVMRKPGTYRLTISLPGYQPIQEDLVVAPPGPKKQMVRRRPWKKEITNSIGMKLVRIPAGKFTMGASKIEQDAVVADHEKTSSDKKALDKIRESYRPEGPQHEVEITKEFWLGVCEVTQKEFKEVMGYNPSFFSKDGKGKRGVEYKSKPAGGKDKVPADTSDFPVENVSHEEAEEFCNKLTALASETKSGRKYRLPTEAEWEYACRGGTASQQVFSFGNALSSRQANFNGRHPFGGAEKGVNLDRTSKVGSYKKNGFGLYDMHGNVFEWCSDRYGEDYYGKSPRRDPAGLPGGSTRVFRGGSCYSFGRNCRSAKRVGGAPVFRLEDLGFRVALVPSGK